MRNEMMNDLAEIERDLGIDSTPRACLWNGRVMECSPSSIRTGTVIDLGGQLVDIQLSLVIRWTEFITIDSTDETIDNPDLTIDDPGFPSDGDLFEFPPGTIYKVVSVTKCPFRSHVQLDLGDPDR